MGRSAKLHKKAKKPAASQHGGGPSQKPSTAPVPAEQRKKAGLKAKAHKRRPDAEGHVLGGADYVELMMGSRRKSRQEAAKMPKDPDQQ